jgi:hypothetical protein
VLRIVCLNRCLVRIYFLQVHRNLNQDDGRGLAEAVADTSRAEIPLWVAFCKALGYEFVVFLGNLPSHIAFALSLHLVNHCAI